MPVHSITRLRVRAWYDLPLFMLQAFFTSRQSRVAAGNLGVSVLSDAKRVFWTRTVWTDEAALKAYMMSGAHARAMPKLVRICDEASVVRWSHDESAPPTWAEAHRRMATEGRPSRLRHPSPAHQAYDVAAPSTTSRSLDFAKGGMPIATMPFATGRV